MAEVIITFKIMPESPDIDLDVLEKDCKELLSHYGTVGKTEVRPVAFGLKALIIYLITEESKDEKRNIMDEMEEKLSEIESVNSVEVEDVRRTLEI